MGKCKYCGQSIGLFSKAHKNCIEQYEKLSSAEVLSGISRIDIQTIEWLPKRKVILSQALKLFVDNLGIQIFADSKLPNFLSDIVDFTECKGAKSVLRELIYNNSLNTIINESNIENQLYHLQTIGQKAEIDFGFNPLVVKYVIDAIKFSIGVENEKIVTNSDGKERESPICSNNSGTNAPKTQNVHLEFWGVPLGGSVNEFDKLFKSKGYNLSDYNNPDEKERKIYYIAHGRTEQFIGYGSIIILFESPYTGLVYRVEVRLSKMFTKEITIYNELYPLLIQKYGKPYKDDNIQKQGVKEDRGIIFKIQEGIVSLSFGKNYTGDHSLFLRYEDAATWTKIEKELPLYEAEMRLKKEKEEADYRNKLISDL